MPTHLRRGLAIGALLALLVTGCGHGKAQSPSTTAPAPSSSETTQANPATTPSSSSSGPVRTTATTIAVPGS
jgi:hypothetical protein